MGGCMKTFIKVLSVFVSVFFFLEAALAPFAMAVKPAGPQDMTGVLRKMEMPTAGQTPAGQAIKNILETEQNNIMPEGIGGILTSGEVRKSVIESGQDNGMSDLRNAKIMKTISGLPVNFIENKGQVNEKVKYYARHNGATIYFTNDGIVFDFIREMKSAEIRREAKGPDVRKEGERDYQRQVVRMKLNASNASAQIIGINRLLGTHNYFIGNDRSKWRVDVPSYGEVYYKDVYAGIDLKFYAKNGVMEYDFIVHSGGNPEKIDVAFEGIEGMRVADNGDLLIKTAFGDLRQKAPHIYQLLDGKKVEIAGGFRIKHSEKVWQGRAVSAAYGFHVDAYNKKYALVIDPALVYSTFVGGSGNDMGNGIAVDSSGNVYVIGSTASAAFPTTLGAYDRTYNGGNYDVFVFKISSWGSLVYSTYLGGSDEDTGLGIAVDSSGNAYLTGETISADFPPVNAIDSTLSGYSDAFVAKLNSTGNALAFSTYLGGTQSETGYGIAVDGSNNIYLTGTTNSGDFPTQSAYQSVKSTGFDVFITKFNSSGSSILYSTYVGGNGGDSGRSIAVDASGNMYVAGVTQSTLNFPTASALQAAYGGGYDDGFVLKLNPAGSALVYSTYFGGSSSDNCLAVAVDVDGNAYVTGYTWSTDFPTYNALDSAGSSQDAFITKINGTGAMVYSTYLGGSGQEVGNGIAVDDIGNAYVTGWTNSSDFPVTNALWSTRSVAADAFVTKINSSGSALIYCTYLGGSSNHDYGNGIAVDYMGSAYVTGETNSTNFPNANAIYNSLAGGSDSFVTKLGPIGSCAGKPVKISETSVEYDTIEAAYSAATNTNHTILIQIDEFAGPMSFISNKRASLNGGYYCDFATTGGFSFITNSVTIGGSATVIMDKIIIK